MTIQEEIKQKFSKGISMDRVPSNTFEYFTGLAKEEFANDYGMCLVYLCKVHQGLIPIQGEELNIELKRLNDEIEFLKQKIDEKKKEEKGRLMMDGTRRE